MKTKTKMKTKITPIILSAVMLTNGVAMPVLAAESDTTEEKTTTSSDTGTKKEEVVYVNLNTNGTLEDTYVVNSFAGGEIIDYGMYSTVTVLNTTDPIKQEGDTITINSDADKVYYKGQLDGAEIPWNISVKYYLNDTEYTEESLVGKSGDLKIKLKITQNKNCEGTFYDDFALQTTVTLDTEKYTSIKADDATMANVGSDKQLTFTSLPGQGLDTTITASVSGFEMDAISINGIKMNLDIDVDDEDLMDEVDELVDAVAELDDGANELSDGAKTLEEGGSSLKSGASSLESGTKSLHKGVKSLQKGIDQVQSGLDELDSQSSTLTSGSKKVKTALTQLKTALSSVSTSAEDLEELVEASEAIKAGIDSLAESLDALESGASYVSYKSRMKANGLDIDSLKANNTAMAATISEYLTKVDTMKPALKKAGMSDEDINKYVSLAKQLVTLLNGNNAAIGGMETYLGALNTSISQISTAVSGGDTDESKAASLQGKYEQFNSAIGELATTLTSLMSDMSTLKDGVNTLVEQYSTLDSGISAYTKGVSKLDSGNKKVVSGSSSLASGSAQLKSGSATLSSGTAELVSGIVKLYKATNTMTDGTGEFRDKTDGLDDEVQDKIDEMISEFSGDDSNLTSFVSDKNTKVDSVQFVIQTKAVEQEEEEVAEVQEEKKSFWQKIKDLFN